MIAVLSLTENVCEGIFFFVAFSFISFIIYILMLRITKALSEEDKDILRRMDIPIMKDLVKLLWLFDFWRLFVNFTAAVWVYYTLPIE